MAYEFIAQGARPPEVQTPTQAAGQMLQLRALAQEGQMRQLQMQQAQQQMRDDEAARQLFTQNANPTAQEIYSRVGPARGVAIVKSQRELETAHLTQQKTQLELRAKQVEELDRIAAMATPNNYQQLIGEAAHSGRIAPDILGTLPPAYPGPDAVQQFRQKLLPAKEQLAIAHQTLTDKLAQAAAAREAELQPAKVREQTAKATTAEQSAAGQQPITPYQQAQLTHNAIPNTPAELTLWVNDPKRTPEEIKQGRAALKDLERHAMASRPVGGMTTMFVPNADGGYTATRVAPGQAIPGNAMTAAGVNTTNTLPAQARATAVFAKGVTDQIPAILTQIDSLKSKIGPGAGRWQQLWVNRAGMNDPEFAGLDQDLHLLSSALVRVHFGLRGGEGIRTALEKQFSTAQSPEDLKARIQHAETWIQGYAHPENAGKPKSGAPSAPSSQTFQVRDPRGGMHTFPSQEQADAFKKAAGIQ